MPTLPLSLAGIRNAAASLLLPKQHLGNLYSFDDIAIALNIAADADNNPNVRIDVDAALLKRAFSFDTREEYELSYDEYFKKKGDRNILYYRSKRDGQNSSKVSAIGRFSSIRVGQNASIVRLNIGIDKNRKNELVQCLEEETTKKESRSKKSMNRKRPRTPPHEIDEPSTQKPQDTTEISLVPPSTLIQYNKSGIKASLRYIINGEAGQINIDTSCGTNSKCLERAINTSMGKQGLGMNTCIQLLYAAMNMFRSIIKEGGLKLYDRYHQIVIEMVMNNGNLQAELEGVAKQGLDEFWTFMNSDKYEEVTEMLVEGMRNLQLPVFTRWQTVIPAMGLMLKHEVLIYCMAVAITQDRAAGKYLHLCACEVISLMSLRAKPVSSAEETSQLDRPLNVDDDRLKPGESSQLMTQIRFIHGFAKAVYSNHFTMACQADPEFGLPGYISRLCVERCYLLKSEILELMKEVTP